MYRCLVAFLVLVSVPFVSTGAFAKGTIAPAAAVKRTVTTSKSTVRRPETKNSTQASNIQTSVRTQSAVIENDASFISPEGALYTTSDECG